MLTSDQVSFYRENGYLLLKNVVAPDLIAELRNELDGWTEESRTYTANYGVMAAGRARFDLESGHSAVAPKLRRVGNPVDISETYRRVLWGGPVVDAVADIVGPNVKFHHCKINLKAPGMATRVDYHQDHPFDPHTNDNVLAALLFLDESNETNGGTRVVPGSHGVPISHYADERFVGRIADVMNSDVEAHAVTVSAEAGDLLLLDTWIVHGGPANLSSRTRRILICDYSAADAFPLTPPKVPSVNSGRIVRGEATRFARLKEAVIELPELYQADSFFSVQGQMAAGEGEAA